MTGIVGEFAATDADEDKLVYSVGETTDLDASAHLTAFNEPLRPGHGKGPDHRAAGRDVRSWTRSSYKVLYGVSDEGRDGRERTR